MNKRVIFGATSAIAMEAAKHFAADGDALLLLGRDAGKLEAVRNDLLTRGAKEVYMIACDLIEIERHRDILEQVGKVLPDYDTVLVAYGTLGDQEACQGDYDLTELELRTNFSSVVSLLTPIANIFEERKSGAIAVIASVAGDRGRQSNYIYGSAKGALALFLQGLRNRLYKANVSVLTVKPGFVDTPMIAHMKKGPLSVKPAVVGKGIYDAIKNRKDVVYLPWFWCFIMLIIKSIPEVFFKRLKL
ncbi:SDR family oxidoreductase [Oligoflexia bacterium]|nr:SDR family oxidoreductase [Oligoflexia bacterium]